MPGGGESVAHYIVNWVKGGGSCLFYQECFIGKGSQYYLVLSLSPRSLVWFYFLFSCSLSGLEGLSPRPTQKNQRIPHNRDNWSNA